MKIGASIDLCHDRDDESTLLRAFLMSELFVPMLVCVTAALGLTVASYAFVLKP